MPIRHGGSALKNASTWLRRSCLRTTTFSAASMPWTWNTFLAISKPIVVICMWTAPLNVVRFDATTLWHFDAAERAPSTTSQTTDFGCSHDVRLPPESDQAAAPQYPDCNK